jgi:nitrogen fixation NifU-like protein
MQLDELYQEIILDHLKRPRNHGELTDPTGRARGDNPSCGDEVEVQVRVNADGVIEDIRFQGQGCAISQASASLMTTRVKGKTRDEALELQSAFQQMLTGPEAEPPKLLGDARMLRGVRKFPQRVKCATLAWQALKQALSSGSV